MLRRQTEASSTGADELQDLLRELLRELGDADAETRARRTSELLVGHQDLVGELSRMRREALDELVAKGQTHKQLADLLGMSRARVGQLLASGPKPERALLGTGALTVAVGGKWEAQKPSGAQGAVISTEALAAYHTLAEAADNYGLKAEYEVVPPPGLVHLNRPNLIVIGSPRLLPLVGQVLESDSNLGFGSGAQGWFLTERGTIRRSPSDGGAAADYAYLGRIPRPDSRGTFLYLAGIHAMGTLAAARYLVNNLEEIYREVKNRRWSILIECMYDPDSRAIESVERITPIYTT